MRRSGGSADPVLTINGGCLKGRQHTTHTKPIMYYVCRMTDDFKWIGLRSTHDEDYADQLVEYYSNKYPDAYVDVLDYNDYHRSSVHWP